ncbi:hypothetical protein SRB5_24580 [Streptomyces sp. RB5]|uniref:Tetratricopeptide repeat protein n=1 Tax=Streptomyces smaragdinus TaxID=2585196 RepID=A0A7K0CFS0_9ACTN|nr:tetratricopeptide repeat protein [Streptomyces smaragdinus]MQY12325.1 hypothetical protein [Streptomyces smaragdinus]
MGEPHTDAACGDERLEAEGETALARLIMDGGDLPHAASHLGNAMAGDPQLPEVHEALAELTVRAGGTAGALDLFPMDEPFIGAVVCRAHVAAAGGAWDDAVDLMAAAVNAEYQRPWTPAGWAADDAVAGKIGPDAMMRSVALVVSALPEPVPGGHRAALRPFYDLTGAVLARHPDAGRLAAFASGLARRMGDVEQAVAWAEEGQRREPGHWTSVMLGYALRAADRADDALRVWEAELRRDPSDVSLHVDVAELYAGTGRATQGIPWLERALAAAPGDPLAAPALFGVRFAADGDPAHLVGLVDHWREHPDHAYAGKVLAQHSGGRPWLGRVTPATEATINAHRQFLASGDSARDHEIEFAASMVEPPSAMATVRLNFPRASITHHTAGDPDPRIPTKADVGTVVWRYEGLSAVPAVAAPSDEAVDLARAVAWPSWPHLPGAYDHAVRLSGLPVADLLGLLARPPAPADDEDGRALLAQAPDLWVRGVQTFVCLALAHHRADEPWAGSARRSLLLDLLHGPEDWVNEAAAAALVATAWAHPDTREDVGEAVARRMLDAAEAYRTRPVTILGSLCELTLLCPWMDDRILALARDLSADIARSDAEEPADAEERAREMMRAAQKQAEGKRGLLGKLRRSRR